MYEIFEQLLSSFNISAYKFCKDTGVSQSTISTWKRKKNLINGDTAKVIADYFNVSLEYLMTGKEKEGGETTLMKKLAKLHKIFLRTKNSVCSLTWQRILHQKD